MGRAHTTTIWALSLGVCWDTNAVSEQLFAASTPSSQTLRLWEGSKTAAHWQILGE